MGTLLDARPCLVLASLCLLLVAYVDSAALSLEEPDIFGLFDAKSKRPFCNAFTGCGYKRSGAAAMNEEAERLGKELLSGDLVNVDQPLSGRSMFGMARLRPTNDGSQFGFFPGFLKK